MKDIHRLDWLRKLFLDMDAIAKPIMGIKDWDDSVIINFEGGKLVASCDGPYKKRLVMKSALIHAATDVIVKGGRPLFALDTLSGSEDDVKDMAKALKEQAIAMQIPILGGNTMLDAPGEKSEPKATILIVGKLVTEAPIRDCCGLSEDLLILLGDPIWGDFKERFSRAQKLFACWYKILDSGARIHASKDVTKGGLVSTALEIAEKSGLSYELNKGLPFHISRNLDNFLIATDKTQADKIRRVCEKTGCAFAEVGRLL